MPLILSHGLEFAIAIQVADQSGSQLFCCITPPRFRQTQQVFGNDVTANPFPVQVDLALFADRYAVNNLQQPANPWEN